MAVRASIFSLRDNPDECVQRQLERLMEEVAWFKGGSLFLIGKTADNLPGTFENKDQWKAVPIKSLMNCARLAKYPAAANYAGKLIH